jgi:RNA polymerase sigma factor (sigma-70 family)
VSWFKNQKSWNILFLEDPANSWQDFLSCYQDLITKIIHKYSKDYDQSMEMYTFILDNLRSNNFSKIISYFKEQRDYDFDNWIKVVVRNCCFDWFRKEKGKNWEQKSTKNFSEIDRLILKYVNEYNYSKEMIYEILKEKNGIKISFKDLCKKIDQIGTIAQKITFKYIIRNWLNIISNDLNQVENGSTQFTVITEKTENVEKKLIYNESHCVLNKLIENLDHYDQLLLKLYFQKGLTLHQITRLLREKNIWQVQRKIKKILMDLKKELDKRNIEFTDFKL